MPTTGIQSPSSYQLPPDKYQQAIEFNRQLDALHFISVAVTLAVILLMLRFRAGARLARWGAASIFAILAIPWIASLPISIYRHSLGLKYQLSVEQWQPWLADWLKAGLLTLAIGGLLTIAGFALARRTGRRWWIWAWAGTVIFMIAATYVVPLVFDPLFHSFTPLERTHPELLRAVELVAARAGEPVPPDRIFEVDASEKTRTLNAYMTGFGQTKRIVIWDTAIRRLTPPQIQTVFAHELGHYALKHVPRSIATAALALLVLFWAFRRLNVTDYAALPRLLLIIALVSFFAEPVVNTYSRWQEREADAYELRLMRTIIPNAGANSAQVDQIMAEISLDDPAPNRFIEFWLYDHPSTGERIRTAAASAK